MNNLTNLAERTQTFLDSLMTFFMFWFIDNQFNDYWFQNLHATDIETIARQHVFINAYLHLELTSRLSLIHIKHCSDAKNIQTLSCVLCIRTGLTRLMSPYSFMRLMSPYSLTRLRSPYWYHASYVSVLVSCALCIRTGQRKRVVFKLTTRSCNSVD